MRVLAGMYGPDAGTIEVASNGAGALRDVTGWGTADAIAAGVGMVHQHFMLVPTLTVAENVVLGQELTRGLQLDRVPCGDRGARAVGAHRPRGRADRLVSELSVGEAQRVEILKVLYRGARILILDEPHRRALAAEVRELWAVLRGLRPRAGRSC
jgi:simple sugar transport system ATP-binding protein